MELEVGDAGVIDTFFTRLNYGSPWELSTGQSDL
jgi:hypothetical protein